jgi:hypothetical protein
MPKKSKGRLSVVQSDKKLVFDSKLKSSEKNDLKDGLNLNKKTRSSKVGGIFIDDSKEDENSALNYWYRGELMKLVPDVLSEIVKAKEVIIEQKIELMEALTGCETPNRYNVFYIDSEGQKKFLFKCKEESGWFCRNCVPSSNRPFYLKMYHVKSSSPNSDSKQLIGDFERPFMCTCLCCCRPRMDGYFKSQISDDVPGKKNAIKKIGQKGNMGKVLEPFSCGPTINLYGHDKKVRWKIYGEYCQCGFWARDISVGKCYEVDFPIYDCEDTEKKPVGNIHKIFKGLSELISDSDVFVLTFPKKADVIDRLMLIGSVIMIDYRFYEDLACCECISIL